jgi:hypothetical protein
MSANRFAHVIARHRPAAFGGAGINALGEAGFVASHYLYFRRIAGKPAREALAAAKALPAAYVKGRGYYGSLGPWGAAYQESGDTLRHCSDTRAAGLRFVGYADDLAGLRHTGWHCDDEGRDTLRAAVWQLPGKGRHARLIYGYQEWEGRGEMNEGSATLCVSDIRRVDMSDAFGNLDEMDDTRDAARSADSMAEHDAEERRDYNEAYAKGRATAELDAEMIDKRRELLPLLAELRAVRRGRLMLTERICETLQKAVRDGLALIDEKREAVRTAWGDCPSCDESAWVAGFMDESSFVRAVRLGFAKASDWKGEPGANPCHA